MATSGRAVMFKLFLLFCQVFRPASLLAVFLVFFLQSIAQKTAIVSGNIAGMNLDRCVYLVPNNLTESTDSAWAIKGKFNFKLNIEQGNSYSFRLSKNYKPGHWKNIYVDSGTLVITSKTANLYSSSFAGSRYATDFNSYNKLISDRGIDKQRDWLSRQLKVSRNKEQKVLLNKKLRALDSIHYSLSYNWS
jgi:hypothetical protein